MQKKIEIQEIQAREGNSLQINTLLVNETKMK